MSFCLFGKSAIFQSLQVQVTQAVTRCQVSQNRYLINAHVRGSGPGRLGSGHDSEVSVARARVSALRHSGWRPLRLRLRLASETESDSESNAETDSKVIGGRITIVTPADSDSAPGTRGSPAGPWGLRAIVTVTRSRLSRARGAGTFDYGNIGSQCGIAATQMGYRDCDSVPPQPGCGDRLIMGTPAIQICDRPEAQAEFTLSVK